MEIVNYEEFIRDMVENFNDMTTSDLEEIVEARCMKTKENENAILDDIYNRIKRRDENYEKI